jgi:hypothetical protein
LSYLSQQADPSAGCAQQAPLFSSSFLPGVQQAVAVAGFEQHEDSAIVTDAFASLLFLRTGKSVICNSIFLSFVSLI